VLNLDFQKEVIDLSLDRIVDKARKLLESGKVERLDTGLFNVVGDHGTYIVAESYDGKISCNCPGFVKKGKCSHSAAVKILKTRTRKYTKKR
jgi:predicted nucleic acid-binding Zn finger protein